MNVSCLCPTFGRTALLEESIASFLRQDYTDGKIELIICNDLPAQSLICRNDRIKIINLDKRCDNLGEKRNLTAAYASYEYILTWGDDDIHLPWRISACMDVIKKGSDYVRE